MRNKILFVVLLIGSACSSSWHLKRGIKKNPSIVTNTVDTLQVIIPGETKIIFATDSIVVNEPRVYIKVRSSGDSLYLFYEFLPDTVKVIERHTFFNLPKTRQQVRLSAKSDRLQIRKDYHSTKHAVKEQGQTDRVQIKAESKTEPWFFLIIGGLCGLMIGVLIFPRKH